MSLPTRSRLFHRTPAWVPDTAIFHIRIRCAPDNSRPLTHPDLGPALLRSVGIYTERQRWSCYLFLLMPDHLHGFFSFGRDQAMSETIRSWKRYHTRHNGVIWQENYFDHRLRDAREFSEKYAYIERNPVAKGLCGQVDEWPWRVSAWSPGSPPRFAP